MWPTAPEGNLTRPLSLRPSFAFDDVQPAEATAAAKPSVGTHQVLVFFLTEAVGDRRVTLCETPPDTVSARRPGAMLLFRASRGYNPLDAAASDVGAVESR